MESSKEQISVHLMELMEIISHHIRSEQADDYLTLDLTIYQLRILLLLQQGVKRMSEVATALNISTSSATTMIDRLVNKQLVERTSDAMDRRIVFCGLTPVGLTEVERFMKAGTRHIAHITSILNREELEAVVNGIEILVSALERDFLTKKSTG
jgi:DNA-binding MarR family transcriptional regulator